MILNVDPGCLVVSVARFSVLFAILSPRPPTRAFTAPVDCSMTVQAACGCSVKVSVSLPSTMASPGFIMSALYSSMAALASSSEAKLMLYDLSGSPAW